MKKIFFCFALIAAMGHSLAAQAASPADMLSATDITTYADVVYANPLEVEPGQEITLSVRMKNATAASGFQFDLVLPQGVTVPADEDGFYDIALSTARTTANKTNYFESSLQTDGSIRVLCNSTKGYSFSGTDGEVALVTLNIAEDMKGGSYPIQFKNIVITNAAGDDKRKVELVETAMTVKGETPALRGDINGDGVVNIQDVTELVDIILGKSK